jgi:Transposase IS4
MDLSEVDSTFYNDLVGVELQVPCSTWDSSTAIKCWGDNYEQMNVRGVVEKITLQRKTGQPRFQVKFPEKKYEKVFIVDMEYIFSYSVEVPLKYHELKSDTIKKKIQAAELALLKETPMSANPLHTEEEIEITIVQSQHDVDNDDTTAKPSTFAPNAKKRATPETNNRSGKSRKKSAIVADPPEYESNSSGDENSDNDEANEDASEEPADFFEPGTPVVDVEDTNPLHMDPANWSFDTLPVKVNTEFKGKCGPTHVLNPEIATPFQYFCLFIPFYMWARWATYTNAKADLEMKNTGAKSPRCWRKTSSAELKGWVASVIWWCLGVTQTFNTFWTDDYDRSRMKLWFSEFRWLQIKRYFKVSDPKVDAEKKEDKLQKIRDVWDDFMLSCKRSYWPSQQVGIDEAIKRFKGRCSFKQYIKSKPVRWGLKVFCVCCSATGYLWNASIYAGKTEEKDAAAKEISATHSLVVALLEPLAGLRHIVHMDNWFSSIPLFNELAKMDILSCGTIRTNRKGLDPAVTMKKSEESLLKKNPGTIRFSSYGSLCFMSWFAKRAVHVLTNCYSPIADDDTGFILHWFTEQGSKVQRNIARPPAVKFYNLYMGAVDLYDQYRSYVQMDIRSRKFWHPLFWLIIESALVNSWLLYKTSRQAANLSVDYSFFTFRKSIAIALSVEWEEMGCRHARPAQDSPSKKLAASKCARDHLKKEESELDKDSTRFTAADKHITHMVRIPSVPESRWLRQLLCIYCKKSKTTWMCKECGAKPLCKDGCFVLYHTKQQKTGSP